MKKIGFVLLAALLLVVLCAFGVSATTVQTGNADVLSGYAASEIPAEALPVSDAIDFASMEPDGVYYLTADFTLSFTYGDFTGELYGNGHTITTTAPLFDSLNGATVKDLTISGNIADDAARVGAVACEAYDSTLVGIVNRANVTTTNADSNLVIVAGVVGYAENTTVRYCINYGTISTDSTLNQGRPAGIVGEIDNAEAWLVVESCVNYGYISGINQTAGIMARVTNCASITIKSCVNYGTVYVAGSDGGGIVAKICETVPTAILQGCINSGRLDGAVATGGISALIYANSLTMTDCHNGCYVGCNTTSCDHGKLTARDSNNLGGLIGALDHTRDSDTATIKNCTNTGYIEGYNQASGFIGWGDVRTLLVQDCYNGCLAGCTEPCLHGDVVAQNSAAGGLAASIGGINHTVINFTNTGAITSVTTGAGGIFGYSNATGSLTIKDSYNGCLAGCTASCDHGEVHGTHVAGIVAVCNNRTSAVVIENCKNSGYAGNNLDGSSSGGIVGKTVSSSITINNCHNGCFNGCTDCKHGVVDVKTPTNIGGILGYVADDPENVLKTVVITNCTNNADLSAGASTGGIMGVSYAAGTFTMHNCHNTGHMTMAGGGDMGGVIGIISNTGKAPDYVPAEGETVDWGVEIVITNCSNAGTVTTTQKSRCGGVFGVISGARVTVKNCTNYETGTVSIKRYTGGIMSRLDGTEFALLEGCVNKASVTTTDEYAGGIVGYHQHCAKLEVIDCHNFGDITTLANNVTGGIIGQSGQTSGTMLFRGCTNSGNLTSQKSNSAGIIAQINASNVTKLSFINCHNSGNVTTNSGNAAGIIGWTNADELLFDGCSNSGNMTQAASTKYNDQAAGIIGQINSSVSKATITNCTNSGNLSSADSGAAGILAYCDATTELIIRNCVNTGSAISTSTTRGIDGSNKSRNYGVAGILGYTCTPEVTIENCFNGCQSGCDTTCAHGQVTCNSTWAGGIMAIYIQSSGSVTVKDCTNSGKIHAKWETAGIIGNLDVGELYVENCKNGCFNGCARPTDHTDDYCDHGRLSNTGNSDGGGIIGHCEPTACTSITIKGCYNNGRVATRNRSGGISGALLAHTVLIENTINEGYVTTAYNYCGGISSRIDALKVGDEHGTVTFNNVTNRGDVDNDYKYAGGFIGYAGEAGGSYYFNHCRNEANVTALTYAAGLVGNFNNNLITHEFIDCHNTGDITGANASGGISGYTRKGRFVDCTNSGKIYGGTTNEGQGGIAGHVDNGNSADISFIRCTNSGEIEDKSKARNGGIVGVVYADNVYFEDCRNTNKVTSHGNYAGGIASRVDVNKDGTLTIRNCFNSGNITSLQSHAGGMVGLLGNENNGAPKTVIIENCTNTGEITFSSTAQNGAYEGGGIVGTAHAVGTMTNCVNKGSVTQTIGSMSAKTGGLAGALYNRLWTLNGCINEGNITGCGSVGGLVGQIHGAAGHTVTNCHNKGTVTAVGGTAVDDTDDTDEDILMGVGGLFGYANTKIYFNDCSNSGSVTATANAVSNTDLPYYGIGGIAGYLKDEAYATNCSNSGAIVANAGTAGEKTVYLAAGGIFGIARGAKAEIKTASNSGAVSGSGQHYGYGGMIGNVSVSNWVVVTDAVNSATITSPTGIFNTGVGGMIGYISDSVTSVTVTNCTNETAAIIKGEDNIGGILGRSIADAGVVLTFTNCVNKAEITVIGGGEAGGIASWIYAGTATFTNCENTGYVHHTNGNCAMGGILATGGYNYGENVVDTVILAFYNCVNRGDIKTTDTNEGRPGGIMGVAEYCEGITIVNCSNYGAIECGNYPGGIVARFDLYEDCIGFISNCYNQGNVVGGKNHIGGIVGLVGASRSSAFTLTIENCINNGNISSKCAVNEGCNEVGGIVGRCQGVTTLVNCTNNGTVSTGKTQSGVTNACAGGMIGYASNGTSLTLKSCLNTGAVTSNHAGSANSNQSEAGGMIGRTYSKTYVIDCVNRGEVTATSTNAWYTAAGGAFGTIRGGSSPELTNFTNYGEVSSNSAGGGIVGWEHGDAGVMTFVMTNCANHADVWGAGYVGGIVGYSYKPLTVNKFTNYGYISGNNRVGGLAGEINYAGTYSFIDCVNHGNVANVDTAADGNNEVGGLVGNFDGAITATFNRCENHGNVSITTVSATAFAIGGIVGEAGGTLTFIDCINTGNITARNGHAAGIVGCNTTSTTLTNCVNSGTITNYSADNTSTGGIGGNLGATTATNCVNTGAITGGPNKGEVGGILASISAAGTLTSCVNTGTLIGHGAHNTAGMVGYTKKTVTVTKCVNTGNITGDGRVGGMVGGCWTSGSKIEYCYVSGTITNTLASCGTDTTDGAFGASGLIAYQYGPVYMYYNVVAADIVAKYDDPLYDSNTDLIYRNVAVLANYVNNKDLKAQYNVFIGTLDGGLYGRVLYLGVQKNNGDWTGGLEGGVANFSDNIHHNYSNVKIPLYLDKSLVYDKTVGEDGTVTYTAEAFPIVLASTAANDVASTMNSAAGAGTFVVSNGTVVHKNTLTNYETATETVNTHTHSAATAWTSNADGHWHACTTTGCDVRLAYAAHEYANACDATCNICGYERELDAEVHLYSGACDATCNTCGATRTVAEDATHTGQFDCSTLCQVCSATITGGAHVYTDTCDTTCNNCGATRTEGLVHSGLYSCSTKCNRCGAAITAGAHTYVNNCDTTCEHCDYVRTEGLVHTAKEECSETCCYCGAAITAEKEHTWASTCDTACDLCGATRTEGLVHVGAYNCATECKFCHTTITAAGEHTYANTCDINCDKCGATRTEGLVHTYTNDCDATCDNCAYVRAESELTHTWAQPCSTACNVCGKTIAAQQPHTGAYSCATECQWCGEAVTPGDHTAAHACSETCQNCNAEIEPAAEHTWANDCDTECDVCSQTRTDLKHTFANDCTAECTYCDYIRPDSELKHTFANNCTAKCTYCDFTRDESELRHTYPYPCASKCQYCEEDLTPGEHTHQYDCSTVCMYCSAEIEPKVEHSYSGPCDLICNVCNTERVATGAHQYHSDCDTTCNVCGFVRVAPVEHTREYDCSAGCMYCGEPMEGAVDHGYAYDCDATCEECGHIRTFAEGLQAHSYANKCDADCDFGCGTVRPVGAHKGLYPCSTECKYCNAEIEGKEHKYSNACDADCNYNCGETREVGEHQYTNACDASCNICEALREIEGHRYDNACDADCNLCGESRVVEGHRYDSVCDAECNNCGTLRDVEGHQYDNACDAECNVCGQTREVGKHQYTNGCDATCNICKAVRFVRGHQYGDWVTTKPATVESLGEKSRTCSICGKVDTEEIPRLAATEDDQQPETEQPEGGDSNEGADNAGGGDNAGTGDEQGSNNTMMIVIIAAAAAGAVVVVVVVAVVVNKKKSKKKAQKND